MSTSNRGDSRRESPRFARIDSHQSIRRTNPILIRRKRFARIASNLRFAVFPPRSAIRKEGPFGNPESSNDSQESGDSRESANRFARIRPSRVSHFKLPLGSCRGTCGVPQLHCHLLRYSGPLRVPVWTVKSDCTLRPVILRPVIHMFQVFVMRNQKNPRVRIIFFRNSEAGNGCANFMGAWKNAFFLQEKAMSIKFLVLGGGGYFGFFWGGRECRFYFYGREDRSLPNDNKISDNKIRKISKFYCHGISQDKQRFGTIFRKIPPPQPPPKRKFY